MCTATFSIPTNLFFESPNTSFNLENTPTQVGHPGADLLFTNFPYYKEKRKVIVKNIGFYRFALLNYYDDYGRKQ
jgi:hypothetical protein